MLGPGEAAGQGQGRRVKEGGFWPGYGAGVPWDDEDHGLCPQTCPHSSSLSPSSGHPRKIQLRTERRDVHGVPAACIHVRLSLSGPRAGSPSVPGGFQLGKGRTSRYPSKKSSSGLGGPLLAHIFHRGSLQRALAQRTGCISPACSPYVQPRRNQNPSRASESRLLEIQPAPCYSPRSPR